VYTAISRHVQFNEFNERFERVRLQPCRKGRFYRVALATQELRLSRYWENREQ